MIHTTLVDAATLARHIGDGEWRLFDVRHQLTDATYGEREYASGHIPGAVFLHCDRDLSGPKTGRNGRHPLPDPLKLAAALAASGVSGASQVVVYDDTQGMMAGRLWWMLRWLGHGRVAVLDGGYQAWKAFGGATNCEIPSFPGGNLDVELGQCKVDADYVLANLESQEMCLVDARSPDRFRGENETLDPVGGHIPGARNRFFRDNLAADGKFKPPAVLRNEWEVILDGRPPPCVVHQCGSGISACHNLLAMEYAGLAGSRLYPGSWSEWCADLSRPVAK
ncbi:MAG: sulfurtransferase [Betaproteobacteria bacterium]